MSEKLTYRNPAGQVLTFDIRNAGATVGVISSVDGEEATENAIFNSMEEARQSITDAMAAVGAKRVHENVDSRETRVAALVSRMIEWDGNVVDKWRANFDQDAHHAMEWSSRAFASIANVYVALQVLERLEVNHTCEAIAIDLQREINLKAENPARPTSPTSNLLESDDNAARVKILKLLTDG